MGYKEMALDAGYRGDEADAVAAQLEQEDRWAEEQYWHDRAIEEAEMLDMLKEELNRKFVGICQQTEVRPLKLVDHTDFIEIIHDTEEQRVLIQATREAFEKATANEIVEIINRSNNDE